MIGCNTFPTWNSWPGLFASLVTGNAVVVKPHPLAVLPLAITVEVCREVLAEAGFDPNLVTLAAERPGDGLAKPLATAPRGEAHRLHRRHRVRRVAGAERDPGRGVHREGRRQRGHHRLDGLVQGALQATSPSPCRCTPARCAPPPRTSSSRPTGSRPTRATSPSTRSAPGSPARSASCSATTPARSRLLGGIVNQAVITRLELAPEYGDVVLESRAIKHPAYPDAVVRTPLLVAIDAKDEEVYGARVLRPGVVPGPHRRYGGVDRAVPQDRRRGWRDDGRGLLDGRADPGPGPGRGPRRRGRAVGEPDRPGLREPVGRFQRLPRHRRESGRQRDVHRRRLRCESLPRRSKSRRHRPDCSADPQDDLREVLAYYDSWLAFNQRYQRMPGVQAAVFAEDGIAYSAAYGLADVEQRGTR